MKTKYFFTTIYVVLVMLCTVSCLPKMEDVIDNRKTDVSRITKVILKPSSDLLIADGNAQVDLTPMVYIKEKEGEQMLNRDRIKEEWLEYTSESGEPISRLFSTSDKSLIGKTINVKVKITGTDIVSNTASFKIEAKRADEPQEVVFPVVFHIIQTKAEIEQYATHYDKELFDNVVNKLNNAFGGKLSRNAVGVDTRIRFRMAEYTPSGSRMFETGINRVSIAAMPAADAINTTGAYDQIIKDNKLVWSPEQYLNIWLVSDINEAVYAFGYTHSEGLAPKFAYPGAAPIPGLNLTKYAPDSLFSINESGILYKLQLINARVRTYDIFYGAFPGNNELTYYVGKYLGLLPNNDQANAIENYCKDVPTYVAGITIGHFFKSNTTPDKETETNFFFSENIMDDPTGMHTSVSQDQSQRIWQVLRACPERSSWKSSFAFNGK